jgi:C4-dicarboxylate-specific signal transduction histidine kinase
LAVRFKLRPEDILEKAGEYQPRPDYVIEAAKKHLLLAAELIGELYSRKKVEDELQRLNESLEQRVENRTAEIRERMEELQGFKDLSIGRESRMIALKREINNLLKELGREEKYVIHEAEI